MRAVIQRVSRAEVRVDGAVVGAIGGGFLVYLGVARGDGDEDLDYVVRKSTQLRVMPDAEDKMNRSPAEAGASFLVVSQFTLQGDCRKGNRPGFDQAAPGDEARKWYEAYVKAVGAAGFPVATGVFGAHMEVSCVNDGPVTILLDSTRIL